MIRLPLNRYLPRRYVWALLFPASLLLIGTLGYRWIEGPTWTFFDALYMTSITLTTIGFGETHPLSTAGRAFTIFLSFGGVFSLAFTASAIIHTIISGEIQDTFGKARMKATLGTIRDHVIVCGMGRMGRLICQELEQQDTDFVVIDSNAKVCDECGMEHALTVTGDATVDDILVEAGVQRARALICVLPSDSLNLYIVLSARSLNPHLRIVARAEEESAIPKLRRVGANEVIAPYVLGGHYLAKSVLKPHVGEFLQGVTRSKDGPYRMEQLRIAEKSEVVGKSLQELNLHQSMGILVLSIRTITNELIYNPQGNVKLDIGMLMVVVGPSEGLRKLEAMCGIVEV